MQYEPRRLPYSEFLKALQAGDIIEVVVTHGSISGMDEGERGIWYFLIRRLSPGAGVMTFGKNKATVYAEDEIDTRFSDVAGVIEKSRPEQKI